MMTRLTIFILYGWFHFAFSVENKFQIGRGFRKEVNKLGFRGADDLPNHWLHPSLCGDEYSNSSVVCDPNNGLDLEFKNHVDKLSQLAHNRIFVAVIGNLDYNNIGEVYLNYDISTKYFGDQVLKKWNKEFAAVSSNMTADVLIFAWLNDDANLFGIATRHKHFSSSTLNGVVYDMNWLNYQQFWWFGGVNRMSAIEQALTCGMVQADMYISNGVSHLNSPYSHWYKNSVKPSSDWYYFTLYWLYFFGLNMLDAFLHVLAFLFVHGIVSSIKHCFGVKEVPTLIETLKKRAARPNYYVRVYKSDYCAICREKMVQLLLLNNNSTNNSGTNSTNGGGTTESTRSSGTNRLATSLQLPLSSTSSGPAEEVVLCVDPVILSCGHIFGCACITQSFLSVAGLKCPICQKPALHDENRNAQSTTVATLVMRVDTEEAV